MSHRLTAWLFSAVLLAADTGLALGPHEIALLVNARSPRSLAVANHFTDLRGVPESNIIMLDLPDSVLEPRARLSPADFTRCIWNPTHKALEERGIQDHILAWVYSVDFPVAVSSRPELSLQGITFLRNKVPDEETARRGSYLSPLFAGPGKPDEPSPPGWTLESLRTMLGRDMPLPSMMLGYMGARGNEYHMVLENLRSGARADGTRPTGSVVFVVNDDVRSTCRHWQYPATVKDLADRGIAACIVDNAAPLPDTLIGLMLGVAWIPNIAPSLAPGAMCEHLTSMAAIFDKHAQTKLTRWLRLGATASAGTVTEPYAIWTKFPSACFFTHYADGCTMLESFFLSIRSPLQILLVGEPLACPWKQPGSVLLGESVHDQAAGTVTFTVALQGWERAPAYDVLLDDRLTSFRVEDGALTLPTGNLGGGNHVLRVVARRGGTLQQQVFGETEFTVARRGRSAKLRGAVDGETLPQHRSLRLDVTAEGEPHEVGVVSGSRWLARGPPGDVLVVDSAELGLGPVALRPVALYTGNDVVRGPAVRITVEAAHAPPELQEPSTERSQGKLILTPRFIHAPDGEARLTWLQPLSWPADDTPGLFGELRGAETTPDASSGGFRLTTSSPYEVAAFSLPGNAAAAEFEAEVRTTYDVARGWEKQKAGLVFNYRNARNFDFWGLTADCSAWAFGRCRGGAIELAVARGAFIRPERWHLLAVRETPGGLEGYVNDELVCRWEGAKMSGKERYGFLAGGEEASFRKAAVGPPCAPEGMFSVDGDALVVSAPAEAEGLPVRLRADNGAGRTRKDLVLNGSP